MKRVEQTLTSFTVLRIAEDRHGSAFVEVRIDETGQTRRLYEGEILSLVVDLPATPATKMQPTE